MKVSISFDKKLNESEVQCSVSFFEGSDYHLSLPSNEEFENLHQARTNPKELVSSDYKDYLQIQRICKEPEFRILNINRIHLLIDVLLRSADLRIIDKLIRLGRDILWKDLLISYVPMKIQRLTLFGFECKSQHKLQGQAVQKSATNVPYELLSSCLLLSLKLQIDGCFVEILGEHLAEIELKRDFDRHPHNKNKKVTTFAIDEDPQ